MIRRTKKPDKLGDVLFRIKRGLAGYVSYLAACEMNQAFSDYVLYEPILRILTAQGYSVECEVACPGFPKGEGPGDFDFVADNRESRFAIEVKWIKGKTIDVKNDYNKLQAYAECNKKSSSFLFVFGTKSNLENIKLKNGSFSERGDAVYAEFRRNAIRVPHL
jgi:hypothetical protein